MLDIREALSSGYELNFNDTKYYIVKEIGRGGSSLVYDAYYFDDKNIKHSVRLKEFYPFATNCVRDKNGCIKFPDTHEIKKQKQRFEKAYETGNKLRHKNELMNSTTILSRFFDNEHTAYVVMESNNGCSYDECGKEDLCSTFTRLLALSKIIFEYHKNGYLHLDIKPDNIFVIPETKEHIYLYDFDSVFKLNETSKENCIISCTKGFAAPELFLNKVEKLSYATDIFSIGAVLFFKLFERMPTAMDYRIGNEFDIVQDITDKDRYSPKLLKLLRYFFKNTLISSPNRRWQTVEDVINSLEKMIELSNVNHFIKTNFSYNSTHFIGREKEIYDIFSLLKSQQVVFISGMGGIGKTEIAKRFAYEYQKEYDSVSFLSFNKNLVNTICSEDFLINDIKQDAEETDSTFFERKLSVLNKISSDKDLIILDNFDVDYDENLSRFLDCRCKFIITTRNDFSDYDYAQIVVDKMNDETKIMKLFSSYNNKKYSPEEEKSLYNIFNRINSHTMLIVLIAKYLKNSNQTPTQLYDILMTKTGLTAADDYAHIKQRKDNKFYSKSIDEYLLILFDLSGFTVIQSEILMSLSLLGFVLINKRFFTTLCSFDDYESDIKKLIDTGWINFDDKTDKISLHQIIIDLVYNHMGPNTAKCLKITVGITGLLKGDSASQSERNQKKRLAEAFYERITGIDAGYARFLIAYYENVFRNHKDLVFAEQILSSTDGYYKELFDINCMKIKRFYDFNLEDDVKSELVFPVLEIARNTKYFLIKNQNIDINWFIDSLIKLAYLIDDLFSNIYIFIPEEECRELLDFSAKTLKEAKLYVVKSDLSSETKCKFIRRIKDFFEGIDFTALYRCENYMDSDFSIECQKIIDNLQCKDPFEFFSEDKSYEDLAFDECFNGNYLKAIDLYKKALNEPFSLKSYIYSQIANVYFKMNKNNTAIKYLKLAFEIDKDNDFSSYDCVKLIDAYIKNGNTRNALKYCRILIDFWHNSNTKDAIKWLLTGFSKMCMVTSDISKKNKIFRKCQELYKQLNEENYSDECLSDFWVLFFENAVATNSTDDINFIFKLAEKADDELSKMLFSVISKNNNKIVSKEMKICALLELTAYASDDNDKFAYCEKAFKIYQDNKIQNDYLYNVILEKYTECTEYDDIYNFRQICDYFLLASNRCLNVSIEKELEIWKDAAEKYEYADKYDDAIRCYNKCISCILSLQKNTPAPNIYYICSALERRLRCYYNLSQPKQLIECVEQSLKTVFFVYKTFEESEYLDDISSLCKEIANILTMIKCNHIAEQFYYISVITFYENACKKILKYSDITLCEEFFKFIEKEFCETLCNDISTDKLDRIAECCKNVLSLENQLSDEVKISIHNFFKNNVENMLEFK